jgi:glycosyltransferase involved in cell wall biosynthesis
MAKKKPSELPKIKLSVALATFNEERNLEECLKSVKEIADEIVVVDGSSSDETVKIARSFGAKVMIVPNKPIFHLNKQKAINECRGEWILQLDADEIVTPELAREIKEIANDVSQVQLPNAFWTKRKKMFLGKWIKKGGQFPDPVVRLFKKGKASLPCQSVHEQMVVEGEVGWLKTPLLHFPTPSFAVYITKDNRYSSLTALEMERKNLPLNFWTAIEYLVWEPTRIFFSLYLRHLGFMDGFPGLIFATYSSLHPMTAYIKYWEIKKSGQNTIEKDWV